MDEPIRPRASVPTEHKPRIRWDARAMHPSWVCAGEGCLGAGCSPLGAYVSWQKDRARLQAWRDAHKAPGPVMHPTAARLQADLDAAIAARPPGWWRALMPAGSVWRDVFMQRERP